jgi:hypothetical protein
MPTASTSPLPSPAALRRRFDKLDGQRLSLRDRRDACDASLRRVLDYLNLAPDVEAALDRLSQLLFAQITGALENTVTFALQEVLGQSIRLKVTQEFKRGVVTIGFHIERDGHAEDIMRGQGGSVANILSVGLRLFALAQLDERKHRRFLVLDEQDCWLAPELIPRLVKIIHDAGTKLGFQVLMISHHDASAFSDFADRIYELVPGPNGVAVKQVPTLRNKFLD